MDDEEDDRSASERVNEFIINHGDVYILPYLDVYDKDKFSAGKFENILNFDNQFVRIGIHLSVLKTFSKQFYRR